MTNPYYGGGDGGSMGLQNQQMKSVLTPRGPEEADQGGPKENLGSVHMGAKPGGLFEGVQRMGGQQQQQKPLNVDGFMNRLRKVYDWGPKLGVTAQQQPFRRPGY
jgi:hypothetical protein